MSLEVIMNEMRASLKPFGEQILAIKKNVQASESNGVEDKGEELANLTLAYRHLEDSIMRLGKVIQAFQGGKSIYDKPAQTDTTVAPANANNQVSDGGETAATTT